MTYLLVSMGSQNFGVIGATSLVGRSLLSLFVTQGCKTFAYTRKNIWHQCTGSDVQWCSYTSSSMHTDEVIQNWICVAPIWVLPEHFELLESRGVRRIIAVSSTSRFLKLDSSDVSERVLAQRLVDAEDCLQRWSDEKQIEWVVLRPTLIYDPWQDKNVSEISLFIRCFGFFPLFGKALGLRQPIHAEDVAKACISALNQHEVFGRAFNLSGGETLPYREMVVRIFEAMGKKPRLFTVPLWLFGFAFRFLSLFPRYKHLSLAMALRMNRDLVFDHSDATVEFGFKPRKFVLTTTPPKTDS